MTKFEQGSLLVAAGGLGILVAGPLHQVGVAALVCGLVAAGMSYAWREYVGPWFSQHV